MINSKFNCNKRIKSGFTLMETMIVVGIIMIVSAVTIGLIPNLKAKLTQKELDSNAETIYQVAQSNLTALKAADLESVYQDESKYTNLAGQSLEEGVDFSKMCYFVAHNDDEFTKKIVPQNEIDQEIWSNNWLVIYNYSSGTVYGVFYSKSVDLNGITGSMQTLASSFSNRVAYGSTVGYHGGGSSGYIIKTSKPKVTVTNGEILYAEFSIPSLPAELAGGSIKYVYTLSQKVSGNHYRNETSETKLIMDDLNKDETRFKNIFSSDKKYCDLVPGLNTYITVKAVINGIETCESDEVQFNSLFSDETKDAENSLSASRQIIIECGRHLQNLSLTSGADYKKIGTTKAVQSEHIDFSTSSEWYKAYGNRKFEPILFKSKLNCLTEYEGNNKKIENANIDYVGNIDTKDVDLTSDKYGTGIFSAFYGTIKDWRLQSCTIANGYDKPTGLAAGIIEGQKSTDKLYQISVSSAEVTTNNGNAGAIAGTITNCNVSKINNHGIAYGKSTIESKGSGNVGFISGDNIGLSTSKNNFDEVYFVPCEIKTATGNAGFLAGTTIYTENINNIGWKKTDSTIAEADRKFTINGGNAAGGLIGYEKYACSKLSECHVTGLTLESKGYAGGLVGYADDIKEYRKCSVEDSDISSTSKTTGGIAGSLNDSDILEDVKVTNCEIVTDSEPAGGIAGICTLTELIQSCTVTSTSIESKNTAAGGMIGLAEDVNAINTCTVTNCTVKADTGAVITTITSAGGLIGHLNPEKYEDKISDYYLINVFKTSVTSNGNVAAAGGIIGTAEKIVYVRNSHVYTDGLGDEKTNFKKDGDNFALIKAHISGGIIGEIILGDENTDVVYFENTDAESVIGTSNTTYSGGLVGQTYTYTKMLGCYSCSYVRGKYIAGLVGWVDNSSTLQLDSCYAAGYLTPIGTGSYAAGLANSCDSASSTETETTVTGSAVYTMCKPTTGTYYAATKGFKTNNVKGLYYGLAGSTGTEATGSQITKAMIDKNTFAAELNTSVSGDYKYKASGESSPYNFDDGGRLANKYPYPQIKKNYGDYYQIKEEDLPDETATSVAYFESYTNTSGTSQSTILGDGDIGLYFGAGNANNTIDKTGKHVYVDSYCVALESTYNTGSVTVSLYAGNSKIDSFTKNVTDMTQITSGGKKYRVVDILDALALKDKINTTYTQFYYSAVLVFNGVPGKTETERYYFNPRLAESVVCSDSEPTKGGTYIVRTPKHLYGLAQTYYNYATAIAGSTFSQDADIDYYNYKWDYARGGTPSVQYPIGYNTNGGYVTFNCNYSGNYHTVKNIVPSAKVNSLGFFCSIGKTINNLFLVNDYNSEYTLNSDLSNEMVGVFAGQVESTGIVRNCAVAGYKIVGSDYRTGNYGYIGGFVGYNSGGIYNCECNVRLISIKTATYIRRVYIGGFVGRNYGYITCSCAAAKFSVSNLWGSNNPFVGGFIGLSSKNGDYNEVWNCYCTSYGDKYNGGFCSELDTSLHAVYYLNSSNKNNYYYSGWDNKTVKYGPTDGAVHGGIAADIDKLHGDKANSTFYVEYNHSELQMGKATQVLYSGVNSNCTLTATVYAPKVSGTGAGTLVLTKFGEWPAASKPTVKMASISVAAPSMTKSAAPTYNAGNDAEEKTANPTSASDVTPKLTNAVYTTYTPKVAMSLAMTETVSENIQENTPEDENSTKDIANTQETPTTDENVASDECVEEVNVKSMCTMPLFVSVYDDETSENITDRVELKITSNTDRVKISTDVSPDFVEETTGKTIAELTDPETGEYKNTQVFMITGAYPGEDELTVTIVGEKYVDEDNPDNSSDTDTETVLINEHEAYEYEPVVISTTVESVRHIGIAETFDEDLKEVNGDIVLPNEEVAETYSNGNSKESTFTLRKMNLGDDENANIILYSVDGFGFNASNGGYTIDKVEIIRHNSANQAEEQKDGTEEKDIAEDNSSETPDDESDSESAQTDESKTVANQEPKSAEKTEVTEQTDGIVQPTENEQTQPVDQTETNNQTIQTEQSEENEEKKSAEEPTVEENKGPIVQAAFKKSTGVIVHSIAWTMEEEDAPAVESPVEIEEVPTDVTDTDNEINSVVIVPQTNGSVFTIYDRSITSQENNESTQVSSWNYNDYYVKIGNQVTESRNASIINYLPITITGRYSDAITFRITLKHNEEIVILECDLASVKSEFNVIHMDGATTVKQQKVGFGQAVYHPTTIEFENAKSDHTGYTYPATENISDIANWTPMIPEKVYEDITFTLVKTPITYKVYFNANGGTGEMEPIIVKYDELVQLNNNAFTNGELEIKGWSLEPEGEIKYTSVMDNAASEQGAEVVLYAIWGEKSAPVVYDDSVTNETTEPGVENWN